MVSTGPACQDAGRGPDWRPRLTSNARSVRDEGLRQIGFDLQGQLLLSHVAGFRYRLHSAEMDELGEFNSIVPNWYVGDTFTTGDDTRFPILRIVRLQTTTRRFSTRCRKSSLPTSRAPVGRQLFEYADRARRRALRPHRSSRR